MKKVIAFLSIVVLAACGGQSSSTDVVVDSTVVADSTVVSDTVVQKDTAVSDAAKLLEAEK